MSERINEMKTDPDNHCQSRYHNKISLKPLIHHSRMITKMSKLLFQLMPTTKGFKNTHVYGNFSFFGNGVRRQIAFLLNLRNQYQDDNLRRDFLDQHDAKGG